MWKRITESEVAVVTRPDPYLILILCQRPRWLCQDTSDAMLRRWRSAMFALGDAGRRSCSWMSGARLSRFIICVIRARVNVTKPREVGIVANLAPIHHVLELDREGHEPGNSGNSRPASRARNQLGLPAVTAFRGDVGALAASSRPGWPRPPLLGRRLLSLALSLT